MRLTALYDKYFNRVLAVLCGLIILSICLYVAFLLGAVAHAAGRTAAERQVGKLAAQVSTLESRYLAETQSLSQSKALAMGFVVPQPSQISTIFANTKSGLTLR